MAKPGILHGACRVIRKSVGGNGSRQLRVAEGDPSNWRSYCVAAMVSGLAKHGDRRDGITYIALKRYANVRETVSFSGRDRSVMTGWSRQCAAMRASVVFSR